MVLPDQNKVKVEYSEDFEKFIQLLLVKDPSQRLGTFAANFEPEGFDDAAEVLSHPFFDGLDKDGIEKRTVEPPFKPEIAENEKKFFSQYFFKSEQTTEEQGKL